MNFRIQELKSMGLEKPGKNQPGFHLAKCRPNTGAWPTAKGDVCKWGMFLVLGETLRPEIARVLPAGGVAMGQIN